MKTKLLLTIIATLLIVGTLFAGPLRERLMPLPSIPIEDLQPALNAGLTDVDISSLRPSGEDYVFNVYKAGFIDTRDILIRGMKVVCVENITEEESCDEPICDEKECAKPVCIKINITNPQICTQEPKTEEELLAERDAMANTLIAKVIGQIGTNSRRVVIPNVGESERVVIGGTR